MIKANRNANLDLLRAIAITMVVIYHVAQMWPHPIPKVRIVTPLGAYGVDLFFVLSGWLIGALFWKEWAITGTVKLGKFVSRRLLRTVPCYLVALLMAWGAVCIGDPSRSRWDWGYLAFVQNYYHGLPYFQVSWSLCVEECFYIVAPLSLWILGHLRPGLILPASVLCISPFISRLFIPDADIQNFAPTWTATHLRFEGLLAGFLMAHIERFNPHLWSVLVKISMHVALTLLSSAIAIYYISPHWFYRVGLSLIAVGFLALLTAFVTRPTMWLARLPMIKSLAIASYSIYLVHALMIHVARIVLARFDADSNLFRLGIFLFTITLGSVVFYWLVEKQTLTIRDRIAPGTKLKVNK